MIWPRLNRMVLWQPNGDVVDDLIDSTRILDLSRDVVATPDDLHGSSYKVTSEWVAGMKARCAVEGEQFRVRERPGFGR